MKRARFTEEQIIGVLKEYEAGVKTADLVRAANKGTQISEARIHGAWGTCGRPSRLDDFA